METKPKLKLVGRDGNAFSILWAADQALKKNGFSSEDREKFKEEAMSGDYDNLLRTCMKWFEVS